MGLEAWGLDVMVLIKRSSGAVCVLTELRNARGGYGCGMQSKGVGTREIRASATRSTGWEWVS